MRSLKYVFFLFTFEFQHYTTFTVTLTKRIKGLKYSDGSNLPVTYSAYVYLIFFCKLRALAVLPLKI